MDSIELPASVEDSTTASAPWLPVPSTTVVNIEHPCIIKNLDGGIRSLGGARSVANFLSDGRTPLKTISATLRPDDPVAKPIPSQAVSTHDLLLKITTPMRTGRRRKRGSTGPWEGEVVMPDVNHTSAESNKTSDPNYVLRSIRDNPTKVSVVPVGTINESHRFRSLPDFQYAALGDKVFADIRDLLLPLDIQKLNKLNLSPAQFTPGTPTGPPPSVEPRNIPFNWSYRQNPNVKFEKPQNPDERPSAYNSQKAPKPIMHKVVPNAPSIPDCSPVPLPAEDTLDELQQKAITAIRKILEERPIVSRRVLMNKLPGEVEYYLRHAWGYCGYFFTSGPWKDMLIKFGIDPRTDPHYRQYQVLKFKLVPNVKKAAISEAREEGWEDGRVKWARSQKGQQKDPDGHLFDGTRLSADGKVWQLCDIADPLIAGVLNTSNIRTECDVKNCGWYYNGTIAKAQVIMRDKIVQMQNERPINDADYVRVIEFPDIIDENNVGETVLPKRRKNALDRELAMAAEIRKIAMDSLRGLQRKQKRIKAASGHEVGKGKRAEAEEMQDEDEGGDDSSASSGDEVGEGE